jgi:hypothetical protein
MQSSSSGLSFKQSLAGASPATETISNDECRIANDEPPGVAAFHSSFEIRRSTFATLSRCKRYARLPAKEKVRGANPRESTSFNALVPQQPQERFCKPPFVGASPTEGSSFSLFELQLGEPFHVGHDVTAASRPVTAPVRVQIPLANPISVLSICRERYDVLRSRNQPAGASPAMKKSRFNATPASSSNEWCSAQPLCGWLIM